MSPLKTIVTLIAIFALSGCATRSPEISSDTKKNVRPVASRMADLAEDIKRELMIQNSIQKRDVEYKPGDPITVEFEGTLEDFSAALSKMGFQCSIIGKRPNFDLYLNLHYERANIVTILEDAATQLPDFVHIEMRGDKEIVFSYES